MESSVDKLFKELREKSGPPVISEEEYKQAEREINAKMEEFAREQRAYFAYSIESARNAYITF
jgi:hypothetical protein